MFDIGPDLSFHGVWPRTLAARLDVERMRCVGQSTDSTPQGLFKKCFRMNKAQVIHALEPPDVMTWQEWLLPDLAAGEVRLRHTSIGVNYADTYHQGGVLHP